jgi:hypothetical protein
MFAKLETHNNSGKNYAREKVLVAAYSVVGGPDLEEFICCRVYTSRSSPASKEYASIWIRSEAKALYISGSGYDTGYGMHTVSAAIGDAISASGIRLLSSLSPERVTDIKGRGDKAIQEAFEAIVRDVCGYSGKIRIFQHS